MRHATLTILLGAPLFGGLLMALPDDTVLDESVAQEEVPPVELGAVTWERKLEVGLATAKEAGKPVLLLFQEIPG